MRVLHRGFAAAALDDGGEFRPNLFARCKWRALNERSRGELLFDDARVIIAGNGMPNVLRIFHNSCAS